MALNISGKFGPDTLYALRLLFTRDVPVINTYYSPQVFPDWFANNTQEYWTEALKNWSTIGGVEFSGIWLDMNEASSFCDGSWSVFVSISKTITLYIRSTYSGTGVDLANTSVPFLLPGVSGNPIIDYPEGFVFHTCI